VAKWVDEDSHRTGINPVKWNYTTMGVAFVSLVAFFVVPLYLSLPGALVLLGVVLRQYIPVRNRRVLPTRRLFTPEHRAVLLARLMGVFGIKPKGVEKKLARVAKTQLPVALFFQAGRVASPAEAPPDETDPATTVKEVIGQAARRHVRDIYVVPGQTGHEVSFRIDGVMHPGMTLERLRGWGLIGLAKNLADLGSPEPHFRVQLPTMGKRFTVRVGVAGEGDAETLTLRMYADVEEMRRFDKLGLTADQSARLKKALDQGRGLITVASPTDMGARTTVYAMLDLLDPFSRNIVTFERPVTGTLASVEQNDLGKLTAPLGEVLREKLRQEYDVMMLSEITDKPTALVALTAAQREQLVIARFRLPDAVSVVGHLLEMGLDPAVIARGLHTVAAERLVRMLCEKCRVKVIPSAELLHRIGRDPSQVDFFWEESAGCESCGMTGFHGRMGIFEVWQPGEESRRLIATGASAEQFHAAARHDGMISVQQAGLEKVLEGITSLKEVARVLKVKA
jgi:type II secretory ATPase GspE/PulE/Tfp pilus assembly ATPase PilB-like protein